MSSANGIILSKLNQYRVGLREVKTLYEAKEIKGMADAAFVYAKEIGASTEILNLATDISLRAERRYGELLETQDLKNTKHTTGGGSRGSKRVPLPNAPPTLKSLGITKKESARAQLLAKIPIEEFEEAVAIIDSAELSRNAVLKKLKEKVQREKRTIKRKEKAAGVKLDERILVGDFRKLHASIPDGSLPLIFTDPPYDRKALKLIDGLGKFAAAKLADGGSLIAYVGHIQIPEALNLLSKHLRYWWTIACIHSGNKTVMREYGINAGWKAVLWFVKGTRHDNSIMVSDVMSGGQEKSHHDWQQAESEATYWIEKLCPEDGIVCDPFLGGGTTAVAAQSLKRKWIGFEIDSETAKIASGRLNK